MFGDFEAQRHWMEMTIHVPIRQWYRYGPEWWNLDCKSSRISDGMTDGIDPPLTAYVSWACGKM